MYLLTIGLGAVLVLLGLGSYVGSGAQSVTALIPAFIGLPILILGLIARNEGRRKIAIHIAIVLVLLGFIGTVPGVFKLFSHLGGAEIERLAAVYVQSIMAVLCFIYLIFAVKSFVDARRK
ncbi:MAG: hypothetical protein CVV22_06100 [Ignavibacteriae bacterium HGW-Ignavibacteriae-1]|jgi:mannose/fructose/N-acetylgalactosamine-specific phosphotransferase system component IIC|nr:MAG: hypothetical protein CVV22_06100 [Ignavibacteriae bacterium HGW-Ignavibacteriae-1]